MKNIIYFVMLFGLILNPLKASSQNKEDYLSSAYASFEKGEYDNAQKALNVYVSAFDGDASELANKIQQCKDFMNKAESAIARQQIKDAIDYYRCVLSINPNDPIAKKKIADLEMTVKNDDSQVSSPKRVKINPIKPISSGFGMRISSSFDSKGIIGFGVHYNKSYSQFGVGFLISVSDSMEGYHLDNEYIYPIGQFFVSPGINLKYFSIECGLGVFICEKSSIKPYFTARPTIVGYFPFSENHDCLSVSLGYNFVSGAEPLNGFVVGLGFSFNLSE